jgi:hypothetical protein
MPKAGTRRPAAIGAQAEARATNATNWQPLPGMVKRRCLRCRYWFAVPVTEAEATSRCPDCAALGTRTTAAAAGSALDGV